MSTTSESVILSLGRDVYDKLDTWILVYDSLMRCVYFNESFKIYTEIMTGQTLSLENFVYPYKNTNKHNMLVQRSLAGEQLKLVTNLKAFNDRMHWYEIQYFPMSLESKNERGVCCLMHDITSTVMISHGTMTKYQYKFLRELVHQLRAPMNGIMGLIDIIGMDVTNSNNTKHITQIKKSSTFLLQIINDIIDMDQSPQAPPTACKLNEIVEDSVSCVLPLVTEKKLHIIQSIHDISVSVALNFIKQVIINLVDNAIKYSPEDSAIEIYTTVAEIDDIPGCVCTDSPNVELSRRLSIRTPQPLLQSQPLLQQQSQSQNQQNQQQQSINQQQQSINQQQQLQSQNQQNQQQQSQSQSQNQQQQSINQQQSSPVIMLRKSTSSVSSTSSTLSLSLVTHKLILYVRDNGCGVSESMKPLLFQSYDNIKESIIASCAIVSDDEKNGMATERTGFGLHRAKVLMDKIDGKIGYLERLDSQGSIFWISIPLK